MRTKPFVLLASLSTLVAAGCAEPSDGPLAAPTAFSVTNAAQCQLSSLPDLARTYLAGGDLGAVRTLIANLQGYYRRGDFASATEKGFDALRVIGTATDADRQVGTPQNGSTFANALLACMRAEPVALPIDFTGPLGPGAFAVRGSPGDGSAPVLSRDDFSGIGLAPLASWSSVLGQRALIYGEPNPGASFNELVAGLPYAWSTAPVLPTLNPGAVMGFCVQHNGEFRIEESHATGPHTLLALRDPSFFLPCPNLAPAGQPGINLLGPVGGSATGFSDFASVDAIAINLSFISQPGTSIAGQVITPPVRVLVRGNGGTPLPEVTISFSLVVITGSGTLSGTTSKVTGTGGMETFGDLSVSQPGTYALLATASLEGFADVQVQSATFTVAP